MMRALSRPWIALACLCPLAFAALAAADELSLLERAADEQLVGAVDSAWFDVAFPIPGAARATTDFAEGHFRALRPGRQTARGCGGGHCGVDLSAPERTPVIAARAGVVEQIERSPRGVGGKWVRLRHADGSCTWYMHLAEVRDGLGGGLRVVAGELLGTLGRTGVTSSPTHLHFAVSFGKPRSERYVDPGPLLSRAILLSQPAPPSPSPASSLSQPLPAASSPP